jgi:uroporphyrin-III C-methyltransferase
MSKLQQIMDIFAGFGKRETAVAIIQDGTTPAEKIVIGKVKDIVFRSQAAELRNPAVIIVGDVVDLHATLIQSKPYLQISADGGGLAVSKAYGGRH